MKSINSNWEPESGILRTELRGTVTSQDIEFWRDGLYRELNRIPDNSRFLLLLDLHGFEPENLETQKTMRNVIPEILAAHGMRPAFIDLFDDKPEMRIFLTRGIQCIAFANVHHDPAKMDNYEKKIAKPEQRFFTDPHAAEEWLAGFALQIDS